MYNAQQKNLRIGLCVEGKTDIAVYLALIKRLTPNFNIRFEPRLFRGYSKMLRSIGNVIEELVNLGMDIFIIIADNDRNPINKRYLDLETVCKNKVINAAIGIAVQAMEAWLLADEKGLSIVKGSVVNCFPSPERIKHPDIRIKEVLSYRKLGVSLSEALKKVIEHSNLGIIEKRCRSFQRFNAEYNQRINQTKKSINYF